MRKSLMLVMVVTGLAISACGMRSHHEPVVTISAFDVGNGTLWMTGMGDLYIDGMGRAGRLTENGEIYNASEELVATISSGGRLETSAGDFLASITANGTIDNGSDEKIRWSSDGHLMKDGEDIGLRLSPADSAARRAASILVLLYLTPMKPSESSD